MSVFGKAKFGGNKRNWFKLKDGDSVFRILPPMGDNAEDGRWSQFFGIHYGYKNSKGEMRTFQSPLVRNNKTKMIEVPDAALERINQLTAKLADAKAAKNDELVGQLLKLVGGQKSRYNLDNNHYLNVIDLQGNIGILKIRHKAKLALDTAIKKLRDNGIEPLDPENGRYFVFSRSGIARDTLYQVTVYKKKLNVDGVGMVEQDVVHTITDDIAKRCLVINKDGSYTYKEAANLSTLFKKPTAQEVARIVQEGEKAVDEILDGKGNSSDDSGDDDGGLEEEVVQNTNTNTPRQGTQQLNANSTVTAATIAAVQVSAQSVTLTNDTGAVLDTTKTATQTAVAPKAEVITEVKGATAPKTTAQAVSEQTDEEFLKSLGL